MDIDPAYHRLLRRCAVVPKMIFHSFVDKCVGFLVTDKGA